MGLPTRLAAGAKYKKAWENFVDYLENYDQRPDKVGQGTPKPAQADLIVRPFGTTFDANNWFAVRGTQSRWDTFGSDFTGHTKLTSAAVPEDLALTVRGFTPARIVIRLNMLENGVKKVSARTKMPYLDYGGDSGSIPFGASAGSDEELVIFNTLKAAVIANNGFNPTRSRVSRIKEKI